MVEKRAEFYGELFYVLFLLHFPYALTSGDCWNKDTRLDREILDLTQYGHLKG